MKNRKYWYLVLVELAKDSDLLSTSYQCCESNMDALTEAMGAAKVQALLADGQTLQRLEA